MGKYTKKHGWAPCQFVYGHSRLEKKRGDACCRLTRACHDGKYFCWHHNPERIKAIRKTDMAKGMRAIASQEARLLARKIRYGLANEVELSDFRWKPAC